MKTHIKKTDLSALSPLLLFAIFVFCAVAVLLSGAKIYKDYTSRDQIEYERRTLVQYLSTRIRQSDVESSWFVGDFDEQIPQETGNTFFYVETIGDMTFQTRVYWHDGALYELYSIASEDFDPLDGTRLFPVQRLEFSTDADKIRVTVEYDDGTLTQLFFDPKCEAEGSE
ncbi:MAG: DUF4860 domain-containing protein [Clostridia bacterium]|nr:DUF4860 domain-containing protein [Clostridia bacterium]